MRTGPDREAAPPAEGITDSVAVPARLLVPQQHGPVVARADLIERVCRPPRPPILLITAPAGWGKTTFAAQVANRLESAGQSVAWLSLDEQDSAHDLARDLVAALRRAHPLLDMDLRELDLPPGVDDLTAVVDRIALSIGALFEDITLVLDDVHLIQDPAALAILGRLQSRPPAHLRVVMSARVDPHLPIQRWRMSGAVHDIAAADLALDAGQARQLMTSLGSPLDDADIQRLVALTEGWVGGLRLVARSLDDAPDPHRAFESILHSGGVGAGLADYLIEQVVDALPPATRTFLREISIINPIPVELAERLTGRADAHVLLRDVAAATGFVAAADPAERVYRLHHSLVAALRYQLAGDPADRRRDLHRRASGWFAERDRPLPAARQAILARDWDTARDLLLSGFPRLSLNGAVPGIRQLLADIPRPIVLGDPALSVIDLGSRAWSGEYGEIGPLIRAVDAGLVELSARDPARAEWVRFMRVMSEMGDARTAGRYDDALALIEQAQGSPVLADAGAGGRWRALVDSNLGTAALWTGDLATARRSLAASAGSATRVGPALNSTALLSWVDLHDGRLSMARSRAGEAVAAADRRGWSTVYQVAVAHVVLAAVALEQGDLTRAREELGRAKPANKGWGEVAIGVLIGQVGARLANAAGRPDEALAIVSDVRDDPATCPSTGFLAELLGLAEVDALVALGRCAAAVDRLRHLPGVSAPVIAGVRARQAIGTGQPRTAVALLSAAMDQGSLAGRRSIRIRHQLWLARAYQMTGQHRRAVAGLRAAMDLADSDGYRLPFRELDTHARPLLDLARSEMPPTRRRLLDELIAMVPSEPDVPGGDAGLALTDRERELLTFLPTRMTNEEIADHLGISVNTIKSHARALYRKLDVPNRREAVRRAEQAGLI